MLITHFTKSFHLPKILSEYKLKLEGCNFDEDTQNSYFKDRANIRLLWFTEVNFCFTAKPIITDENGKFLKFIPNINLCGFQFDSDAVGATKWKTWYKPKLIFKKKNIAVNELNNLAIEKGDNPNDYWVSNNSTSLDKCLSIIVWQHNGDIKSLKLDDLYSIEDFDAI